MIALALFQAGSARAQTTLPSFGHVFIVVEENHGYSDVVGSSEMPYLNSLISRFGLATNYVADTHPSIDNYFMLTVGQFEANNDDSWAGTVTDDNIARELNNAGKTWKVYADALPNAGYIGGDTGTYVKHHNPFAYLSDVNCGTSACQQAAQHIVPFTQLALDLAAGTLPQYGFIVPNICNDAHDCPLATADTWLATDIAPLVLSPAFQSDGLLVVLFDEDGNTGNPGCTGSGNNCGGQVACVIISPLLKSAGYQTGTSYHHEDVLRLMAQGIGLSTYPGRAVSVGNMAEFFGGGGTTSPVASLSSTVLSFGDQAVGSASAAKNVTLSNTGGSPLDIPGIVMSGDFAETNTCGSSLAASASCVISVTFVPSAAGARTGVLAIDDNAGNSPQIVNLSGNGIASNPRAVISPASLTFGPQAVDTASGRRIVTLSNTGTSPLSITSLSVSRDFEQSNNCGSSVAPGGSCAITVIFVPEAPGVTTGQLAIYDSAPGSPQIVTLSGSGVGLPENFISAKPRIVR